MQSEGKIIKGLDGLYEIMLSDKSTVSCKARGVFRHVNIRPSIGDNVIVRSDEKGNMFIGEITERKNLLIRPPIANIDLLFITFSVTEPEPVLITVDKLISICVFNKIRPVVVVTKSDLDGDGAERLAGIYRKSGFTIFVIGIGGSGVDELREFIKSEARDVTSGFAGASGVGKSTLMTGLFPSLELETGEISKKISRGRHTTRHVQLYPLSGYIGDKCSGFLADTPGFGLLDFVRFDFFTKDDLPYTFPEFEKYLGTCRYTKCSHTKEEGCAIIEAVKNGTIPKERHDSYVGIYADLKDKHKWDR